MIINKSDIYKKKEKKFLKKHPDLEETYKDVILLLEENYLDRRLRLHSIQSKTIIIEHTERSVKAIDINYYYRITIAVVIIKDTIHLLDLGDHTIYK